MRTTLLFSSLAQKRAGVGVGFRSVLMSAMTDLNLCTHKLPKNFLCRRLQAKLSEWQNVLHKIAESVRDTHVNLNSRFLTYFLYREGH